MAEPRKIIEALLAKTVANGCTPHEAESAGSKAKELMGKYGLSPSDFEKPKPREPFFRSGMSDDIFNDMFRRAAEQAARKAAQEWARRKAQQAKPKNVPEFKTVKDAVLFYLNPGWINSKTKKPLSNADIANLVRRSFPNAKTTAQSVAWYRNKRKQGYF